jgi:SpoVK/Ycf46/Vps4 family AAA+-type ATPase
MADAPGENPLGGGVSFAGVRVRCAGGVSLAKGFDEILDFELPTPDLLVQILKNRPAGCSHPNLDFERVAQAALRLSFADSALACDEALKKIVLADRDDVTTEDIESAIASRTQFHRKFQNLAQ